MTEPDSAYGNAVSRVPPNRRTSGQGGQPPNRNNTSRGRGERDRCLALRGKCFRCAKADHMIPACTYPDSVKFNLCGAVGHVTPACGRRQVAQMAQHIPPSPSSTPASSSRQLAIAYDGGSNFHADSASASWPAPSSSSSAISSNTCASVFYTPSNLPTPEMPL